MLKGIPVDTFFEAMGMFASAMGTDCTFCHVSNAYFDKNAFATPTPRIQRARAMIAMMNAINKQYFGGQPRVTCFTCHAGSQAPRSEPDLAQQYGAPTEDPNARSFPVDTRFTRGPGLRQVSQGHWRPRASGQVHELHRQGNVCRVRHGVRQGPGGDLSARPRRSIR